MTEPLAYAVTDEDRARIEARIGKMADEMLVWVGENGVRKDAIEALFMFQCCAELLRAECGASLPVTLNPFATTFGNYCAERRNPTTHKAVTGSA